MSASPPRLRVLDVTPVRGPSAYVCDLDDVDSDETRDDHVAPDHATKLELIGAELGCSRQRVQQIEAVALLKAKCAFEIDARLGATASAPVLTRLRGRPLSAFREALAETCRRWR